MRIKRKNMVIILIVILLVVLFYYLKFAKHYPREINLDQAKEDYWGVTFSRKFCDEIGIDWKKTYLAILDDLKVKNIRIPIYWDEIEVEDDQFDFKDYDFIFNEGKKRGVKFTANVGWRLPRWPECHSPKWIADLEISEIKEKTLEMLKPVVNHFKDRKEIVYWQVENEPLLNSFGICPDGDEIFLKKEVELVRSLDQRPILITASGELSSWRKEWGIGDTFGTTMYRVVWNPFFGYFRYPLPAGFYKFKASFLSLKPANMVISELQAEPWVPKGTLADLSADESNKSFDIQQFKANLQYAINADLNQAYLWGVEWWYLRKENGSSEYWDLAKSLFDR
jgi:hypothetical protein